MRKWRYRIITVMLLALLSAWGLYQAGIWYLGIAEPEEIEAAILQADEKLTADGLAKGMPVYLRVFKAESLLELWLQRQDEWVLFDRFPICAWSGDLGPKLREGDRQAPEGFYRVGKDSLNPNSSYYLSFNLGFPNVFDAAHGRTGSFLMIHGRCVSAGCYAMTDPGIAVIYGLVEAALRAGQGQVPVHIFPFRMTAENLQAHQNAQWIGFWRQLKPAYDIFEQSNRLPGVTVLNKRYQVLENEPA